MANANANANANDPALHLIQGDRVEPTWKRRCKPDRPPPAPAPQPRPGSWCHLLAMHGRRLSLSLGFVEWSGVLAHISAPLPSWDFSRIRWSCLRPFQGSCRYLSTHASNIGLCSLCQHGMTVHTLLLCRPLNHQIRLPPDVHAARWIPNCQATATL